ncbi:crossover junction endodeoxyribonuclease RuvC [candidate division KSB1 bacterium]|nr:crossover junction endodeoxyribonuclease RuvC [candidate division KSB1 bacterium]
MPKQKSTRILAIDPGTRHIGVALLENGRPLYHGVKSIENRASSSAIIGEGKRLIRSFIQDFKPDSLAIEKTFFGKSKNLALLNILAKEFALAGQRTGISVVQIAPTSVRKQLCGNGRATKADVTRVIVSKFPEFKVYLTQDRKWKQRYHWNMFDAIALGIVASKR